MVLSCYYAIELIDGNSTAIAFIPSPTSRTYFCNGSWFLRLLLLALDIDWQQTTVSPKRLGDENLHLGMILMTEGNKRCEYLIAEEIKIYGHKFSW